MNGRAALLVACASCAACSLFLDTEEFSGDDGAASGDGGTESSIASDAAPDVTAPGDGGGGADAEGDGDARPPCPDGGFCDSFERTSVIGPWSGITDDGHGCTLTIDTLANDGASSLKLFVPERATDDCEIVLARDFAGVSPKHVAIGFDIRVDDSIDREIQIAGIAVTAPDRALFLMNAFGTLRVAEQRYGDGGTFNSINVGGLTGGAWHRVDLDYDIATRDLIVSLDGVVRLNNKTGLSFSADGYSLYLGDRYSRGGSAATVWFDDYRAVVTP